MPAGMGCGWCPAGARGAGMVVHARFYARWNGLWMVPVEFYDRRYVDGFTFLCPLEWAVDGAEYRVFISIVLCLQVSMPAGITDLN